MTKTVAICQARMGSTRLPGKVLKTFADTSKPLMHWTYNAAKSASGIDLAVIATTTHPEDDAIADYCDHYDIPCFRGSEKDVLDRFYQCAKHYEAKVVLRFTCDCPFLDHTIISQVIKLRQMTGADYASNCYPATFPDGLDTECFKFSALEAAWNESRSAVDRDCLTQFIVRNQSRFKVVNLSNPLPGGDREHWVCDSPADFEFCNEVAKRLWGRYPSLVAILDILDKEPELREINKGSIRNERFYEALSEEQLSPRTFAQSRRVFERAIQTIPTGAQTFSKSHLQFPAGGYPLYVTHSDGAYVFDVDGNRYVDLVGALCPIILGYNDPDVNTAIKAQLDKGISFSLSTELEVELAETLTRLIPCAEMVKFGKNGTDVTTAAVRLARAYTGKEYIFSSGYHGWADWSMATTNRNSGIPRDVKDLTTEFKFGDKDRLPHWIDSFPEGHPVAAVIVEPNDDPEYLKWLREFCTTHGIVLIFDEIITGFRYDLGGAQSLYGVTPDLACFGKAIANGMPLSALVGKKEIMSLMNTPDVFYSGTFFGETLSLAAAIATINKMEREGVVDHVTSVGIALEREILKLINKHSLNAHVSIDGWYTNQKVKFHGDYANEMRTLFMFCMAQNGVLIINSNVLSYAHKAPEIKRIVTAYDKTFEIIEAAISSGKINDVIAVEAGPVRVA
jgi:glutamate-1-semialdehyde aminotransferase/spore coat polysaccharide biosynthesis protein SpsF (cytidylyltransferase family)